MAESVLADEIVVIAALATQDARSAQYTVMLDGMREHGHDNAATCDFLNRDLDLPTPEQAAAARIHRPRPPPRRHSPEILLAATNMQQ